MKYILFLINDFRWSFGWNFPIKHPRYSISVDEKTGQIGMAVGGMSWCLVVGGFGFSFLLGCCLSKKYKPAYQARKGEGEWKS